MQHTIPSHPMRSEWPDQLIELLERQQTLASELTEMTDHQGILIHDGRTDDLLMLLGRRQGVVDAFVATQDELAGLTVDLDDRLTGIAASKRERIRSLLGAIGHALTHVMERDGRDQQALQDSCDRTRRELSGLGNARAAHHAYRPSHAAPASGANRFADRQG
jgi:FlgN protein